VWRGGSGKAATSVDGRLREEGRAAGARSRRCHDWLVMRSVKGNGFGADMLVNRFILSLPIIILSFWRLGVAQELEPLMTGRMLLGIIPFFA